MASSSLAILLAILAGFVTIQTLSPLQHRSRFQEWDRVVLESALIGGLLFALVRVWIIPWFEHFHIADLCRTWCAIALPIPFGASAMAAILVGFGAALVMDFLLWVLRLRDDAVRLVIRRYGGDLLSLLVAAFTSERLLSISLKEGKAYVGYLARTPSITKERTISLVPILSGYRDPETRELVFTTDYAEAYAKIAKEFNVSRPGVPKLGERDFEIVFSLHEVLTTNLFDVDLYERYFRPTAAAEDRSAQHSH